MWFATDESIIKAFQKNDKDKSSAEKETAWDVQNKPETPPPIHEQSKWPLRRSNPRERFVHEVKIVNVTPRKLQEEFFLDTAAYANIQKQIKPPLTDNNIL